MAELIVVGSGSSGNSYIIRTKNEDLLLELGVKWKDILAAQGFDASRLHYALASHSHVSDHFNLSTVRNAYLFGVEVYTTKEAAAMTKYARFLEPQKKYRMGGFQVMPLSVPHSVECFAYIIEHDDFGKLLFITDATDFPYNVKSINHLMIETNYTDKMLESKLLGDGVASKPETHMSLNKAIEVSERLFSGSMQNVVCLHLSDQNSDESEIIAAFKTRFGLAPVVADKGVTIKLDKNDF